MSTTDLPAKVFDGNPMDAAFLKSLLCAGKDVVELTSTA
jgi:hypothetical protein